MDIFGQLQAVDILAVGVHPDDVELSCAGTLLKHIALGHRVGLLDLTRGELGSRGSADTRDAEARRSAELMGAHFRHNLGMADGFFSYSQENLLSIVSIIRAVRPRIVLANSLDDRHPDHGRAAKLVADACFYAGLLKIETRDAQGQPQAHWRPEAVYHYIQDYNLKPDVVIDISPYFEQKMACVLAFGTQFYNPATAGAGPQTPISGADFMAFLEAKARSYGRPIGAAYGEGFNTTRWLGAENLFVLR